MDNIITAINSFHQGENFQAYKIFGAHPTHEGVKFTLWAPNAQKVSVVGNFNNWDGNNHQMEKISEEVWQINIPGLQKGEIYKYKITTKDGRVILKADPFAFYSEVRPATASVVAGLEGYPWNDQRWQERKNNTDVYQGPLSIYEVHLGTWKRKNGNLMNYRELVHELVPYVKEMGYTHLELMPVMEHPFDGSWGYQVTGFYSPTSRYGTISDLKYFIDYCHQNQIGVILDWVPSHFCRDDHGLRMFDGSPCFENENPKRADNPQWGTSNFDYGKGEVISFLISNALYWIKEFHADGLRVDAVANILYLDFCKDPQDFVPNKYGTNENLEGIEFLKKLNTVVKNHCPNTLMIAEDSSIFPKVTGNVEEGGLGFTYKWNLGWMNDTLNYMSHPWPRKAEKHHQMTFSLTYSFLEKFLLPLSHDEVVHGKKSLIDKMDGDYWQKFAALRTYYGFQYTHPGKKLLFMGGEFGQFIEWRDYEQLEWHLLEFELHKKLQSFVKDLNHFYQRETTLWELDYGWNGFQWLEADDKENSIYVYQRMDNRGNVLIVICNFTPNVHHHYSFGVITNGVYEEVFNSDLEKYGGSNLYNGLPLTSKNNILTALIPPLAIICLKLKK
ncbi:1,4-alpha-glucan branching enzyme [Anaerobranca californiensis DSM 14826]|jgi:1,4-alpha-glucan branching enzyme|uniref:1,4-alpha-glucan branching enzyme GlgB n=1 Tax=Anaerobranca californiensis DSM 14826 TaxID=1120989 RepID=A0A1M6N9M6_9FIRM|nr:1,4-alpha-glucan branching protein GlgB [Anaerobranca californiensis]SHJ92430.1 1,4-alpha-glucan branching enzyme [Anaerobranca californiensis DSM 14826]